MTAIQKLEYLASDKRASRIYESKKETYKQKIEEIVIKSHMLREIKLAEWKAIQQKIR